jgi:hypothetical protein
MKASIVFATGLMLAAGLVASPAHAGQGGAAGTISASFSTGNVLTATAGAVAVGKDSAVTTGRSTGTDISAVAVGAAGEIDLANINGSSADYTIAPESAARLGIAGGQGNNFSATARPNLRLGTQGIIIP